LILAGFSLLSLLILTFYRNHVFTLVLTLAAFLVAGISILFIRGIPSEVSHLLYVDSFGLFFTGLILFSGFVITIISHSFLKGLEKRREEYYVILLLGSLGGCILALANHFISFFLGLELLSISLYILISYTRDRQNSIEAAIKYLLLAGVSSAILLMGMSFIYAMSGTMTFSGIGMYLKEVDQFSTFFLTGFGMIITGIGFKMALVPFHLWTPDVYEGAPAPTTAFIATISKASIVILLLRFYLAVNGSEQMAIIYIFSGISVLSMLFGNLLALLQQNLKRLLAYSSIAHLGYILVALIAGGAYGMEAVSFYLIAYVLTILGAFSLVSLISNHDKEVMDIQEYRSLFWTRPWLASGLTILLLSLAGIPLTIGFIGKYYLLIAGIDGSRWILVIILIISSVIGLFYYLRVIVEMIRPTNQPMEERTVMIPKVSVIGGITLVVLTVMVIFYGTYPSWLSDLIKSLIFSG
jgi:NADH-quinone oxidoreductase subunit N